MPRRLILVETAIVTLILVALVAGQLLVAPEPPARPREVATGPVVKVRAPRLGGELPSLAPTPVPPPPPRLVPRAKPPRRTDPPASAPLPDAVHPDGEPLHDAEPPATEPLPETEPPSTEPLPETEPPAAPSAIR